MNNTNYENKMIRCCNLLFGCIDSAKLKDQTIYTQMNNVDAPGTAGAIIENEATEVTMLGSGLKDVTNAVTREYKYSSPHQMTAKSLTTISDGSAISIKEYLAKPYNAFSGSFAAADAGLLLADDCFNSLVNNPVYKAKMDGVFAIRATTVVTLMVNATRFDAGRYILGWLPTGGGAAMTTGAVADPWYNMKLYSLKTVTQLPHVEIDINKDTEVTLKIPYISATYAYLFPTYLDNRAAIAPQYTSPGKFFLYTYNGLNVLAGVTAGYDIFVHYEDVEVFAANIASQMGDLSTQEQVHDGPVSSVAHNVSKLSRGMANIANNIFGTVSWAADYIAGAASFIGFSKPLTANAHEIRSLSIFPSYNNYDASSSAEVLALSRENKVDQQKGYFGTDIDEMSIDFIKNIYCYDEKIQWTTADASGLLLYNELVSPDIYWQQITDSAGVNSNVVVAPITGLSQLYGYYRGGVTYKFKFVKTEFHTGRLLILVQPWDQNTTTNTVPATSSQNYLHRTIIDTRTCNEFEVEVPYISTSPWKKTTSPWLTNVTTDTTSFARILIYVLTPLKAPATVSNAATLIVEVKGSKDLEFAAPKYCNITPIIPTTLSTQSGTMVPGNFNTEAIGGTSIEDTDVSFSATSMGEVSTNLRQLTKRFGFYSRNNTAASTIFSVYPKALGSMVNNGTANPTSIANGTPRDMYNLFGHMYALVRGGVRMSAFTDTTTDINVQTILSFESFGATSLATSYTAPGVITWLNFSRYFANASFAMQRALWGVMFQVPQYSATISEACRSNLAPAGYTVNTAQGGSTNLRLRGIFSGNTQSVFQRSGADDTNFGVWTGFPPLSREDYE